MLNGLELSDIRLGQTVVVIGAGPIGCMITEVARHMGATKIIVVEHLSARLEQAQKLGADVCILSSEEDGVKRVIEETGGLSAPTWSSSRARRLKPRWMPLAWQKPRKSQLLWRAS